MKKFLSFTMMAMIGLYLFSCSEDEKISPADVGTVDIPDQFSPLSVEDNKVKIEDNGQELLTQLDGMENLPAIEVMTSFADYSSTSSPEATGGRKVLDATSRLATGKGSVSDVFSAMRMTETEPETLQELFDNWSGTFTWNLELEKWDFVAGTGKVDFLFPSSNTSTSNDAKISIHSYTSITGPTPIEDYSGDLPTQVKIDVSKAGTNFLQYVFNAKYNAQGEPTEVNTSMTLAPYKWEIKVINTASEASAEYKLSKGTTTLIAMGAGAKGQFTEAAFNANDGEGVLNTANAYFKLMNVVIAGNINYKEVEAGLDQIYPDEWSSDFDNAAALESKVELYNENVQVVVFLADTKQKIADSEFYSYEETTTYESEEWDEQTETWVPVTYSYTDTYIDLRMIFADGSKSDLETYFETGFENITTDLEDFLEGFN